MNQLHEMSLGCFISLLLFKDTTKNEVTGTSSAYGGWTRLKDFFAKSWICIQSLNPSFPSSVIFIALQFDLPFCVIFIGIWDKVYPENEAPSYFFQKMMNRWNNEFLKFLHNFFALKLENEGIIDIILKCHNFCCYFKCVQGFCYLERLFLLPCDWL